MFPFFRRPNHTQGGSRRNARLSIERLEERLVLSTDPIVPPTVQFEVDSGQYEAGSILVQFANEEPFALEQTTAGIQKAALGAANATAVHHIAEGWFTVELTAGLTMEDALAVYGADPNVLYAEPNYILRIAQLPDDPSFADMWNLENTGQTFGTIDADIDAAFAWDVTTGSGNTIVAVIDTGIDYNHPDLASNIWVNAGEIAGDGIDNDGNNYIDDIFGYDFINHDGDPMDDQGHGTHVAGTIGAVGNNGIGVTGINWDVQLMALKFLGADGSGTTADAIEAIYYAVDNGADVINASWGGDPFSQALYDAIAAAGAADVIFVAAAGNGNALGIGINNDANPFYPSGYDLDNIVAVAAIDDTDSLATFSNYGATTVDLAAPGVDILSTTIGGGYGYNSGTSMAAPHVAGVIALVRDLHPTWTVDQVIQQVLSTVDPLPGLQGLVSTGGRLNAASAVGNPEPPPPPPPPATLPMFEDFSDSEFSFVPQTGNWTAVMQDYTTTPVTEDPDFVAISTLNLSDPLPSNVEIRTIMEADPGFVTLFGIVLSNHLTNGLIIYDYVDADNFKFAGADVDGGRWIIGHSAGGSWTIDAQVADALQADVRYELRLLIENDTDVTLIANGVERLTIQHAAPVTSGAIGFGAKDSTTHFDDVLVHEYVAPVPTTLPLTEDFEDGLAQNLATDLGVWFVDQGRYETIPGLSQDAVSTVELADPLPSDVQLLTTINTDDVSSGRLSNALVIFDYQGPTDFKFAGAFAGVDRWVIGHRTANGWEEYATLNETIDALSDYALDVRLEGDTATLVVDGVEKLSFTFSGDSLTDGGLGVGTQNALARFDDIQVQEFVPPPPPPSTTLPTSEDFNDGVADFFEVQLGNWAVESGRYRVVPVLGQDGVSTLRVADPLPVNLEILATINADDVSSGRLSNGLVIFDYHSPTDFKFAGAFVGANRWTIGHRTASGWVEYATLNETINALTDYALNVRLEGDTVTLIVDGATKISHTFSGDLLTDGDVGVGTQNALARFDDIQVQEYFPPPPPPSTTLPTSENFDDGVADFFEVQLGNWAVESGRYSVVPVLSQDGVSTLRVADPLPVNLEILATINADNVSSGRLSNGLVIFDYHSPTDFKFAGAFVGANRWTIGHRTASGWEEYATLNETINALTDYALDVRLEGDTVTLSVNGATKISHTFTGDSLTDGDVGVGTQNALARFDDIQVQEYFPPPPPPSTTLPASEDFNDGVADFFEVRSGDWTVASQRYRVSPLLDQDGVSTLRIADPLPANVEILATINADDVSSGRLSNAFVIFDYQGPTDFKFAGAYVGADRWLIGQRTAAGWVEYATVNGTIDAWTDYALDVRIEGNTATLLVNGDPQLSYTFADPLNDGAVGVGTRNALANFDDIQVREYVPPPSATLPVSENFDDGVADFFEVRSGDWTVESGRYRDVPVLNQDGVSTLRFAEPLPTDVEILATINADDVSSGRLSNAFVVFDYQSPTDFKFAGAYVAANLWLIGHRDASGWVTDVARSESISPGTDYNLQVILEGGQVRLLVNGVDKLTNTYSGSLTDGDVGVGTRNALAYFDNVQVSAYSSQSAAGFASSTAAETGGGAGTALFDWTGEGVFTAVAAADVSPPPARDAALQDATYDSQDDYVAALDEVFAGYDDGESDDELLAAFSLRKGGASRQGLFDALLEV